MLTFEEGVIGYWCCRVMLGRWRDGERVRGIVFALRIGIGDCVKKLWTVLGLAFVRGLDVTVYFRILVSLLARCVRYFYNIILRIIV